MKKYRFFVGRKILFWIFWRKVSEEEFRAAIRPFFSDRTNIDSALEILARGKLELRETSRFYRVELL